MERIRRLVSEDSGFSLVELVIAVGLLSLVLIGAWGAMFAVNKSSQVSAVQGNAAHDFADPLEEMSRLIMQNLSVKSASPDRLEVWTDRNMDGSPELDAFYVTADDQLVLERWGYSSNRATVLNHSVWVMSTTNYNTTSSTSLFTYYDKTGAVIVDSDVPSKAPSNATRVRVKVMLDMGSGKTAENVRDIVFRNRS